jgi:prepilin-type N-terminal cleavage/methylation domain-containing protein
LGEIPIRKRAGSAKRGFTLVEVIVVLVILAILAAIAIPALTGYIDKAQDKQWEMKARDFVVAVRATLDQAYADGTLGRGLPTSGADSNYLINGSTTTKKVYNVGQIALYDTADTPGKTTNGDALYYYRKAAELTGVALGEKNATDLIPHVWLCAPREAPYTVFNAPAWYCIFYAADSDGSAVVGSTVVTVTYGLAGIPEDASKFSQFYAAIGNAKCNPSTGYIVRTSTFDAWY